MKLTEWVIQGLYLTFIVNGAQDGLLRSRYWWMSGGIRDCATIGHLFGPTFILSSLILLSSFVPPCSLIMSTQKQKGQRAQSEAEAWQCEGCNKTFVDKNSKLLLCEYCDNVYCIECLQLSVTAYNVFKKNSLHWFCAHCEDKVMKNIRNDREIEERCAEFLQKIEGRVNVLEGQITTKVDEKQVREIVENMTTEGVVKESTSQPLSQEAVLATVKDCRDSINREANFIMFRVKELDSDEPLERKENDSKFVNDFLDCIDAREVEVANVTRIGARSKDKKKDRPIKVTCKSSDQKREVMRKVSNLKFIEDGSAQECFKKVSVTHDMSKAERQVNKLKLSEAKEKTENDSQEGKYIYKVRGPPWNRRTVRLRARPDTDGEEEDVA